MRAQDAISFDSDSRSGRLDRSGRRLLYELDRNSRTPLSRLSRLTEIAPHTVRYRVQRLCDAGIIRKFNTVLNYSRLGDTQYKVLLKLHRADEKTSCELISYLMNTESVTWLARFEGPFDIGFTYQMSRMYEFSRFLEQVSARFGAFIANRRIDVNIEADFFPRRYLLENPAADLAILKHYWPSKETIALDDINRAIIAELIRDSRITAADIAANLRNDLVPPILISREAVLARIKQLEASEVITGYNLVLNHAALSALHIKAMISLQHINGDDVRALLDDCRAIQRVRYMVKSLGDTDYELDFEVTSIAQFRDIMVRLKDRHSGLIKEYVSLIITDLYKAGGAAIAPAPAESAITPKAANSAPN